MRSTNQLFRSSPPRIAARAERKTAAPARRSGRGRTCQTGDAAQLRHSPVTVVLLGFEPCGWEDRKPTIRQIYALAAVLYERSGEEFPWTRVAASELIERLRLETGHPAPRPDDTRPRRRRSRRRRRFDERLASRVAAELARELR
jgi:hypothetical protein